MSIRIGEIFDNYCLEAILGEDEWHTTFRATDVGNQQPITLKQFKSASLQEANQQLKFLRTVQTLTSLNQRNIVKLVSYCQRPTQYYLVFEYISGSNLAVYLEQLQTFNKRSDLREVLLLLAQVAEGLAYAHDHNIVHGRIKPASILLERSTQPEAPHDLPLRAVLHQFESGQLELAPAMSDPDRLPYLSPEACLDQPLDGRSDIYSLGILLFQLVTSEQPFTVQNEVEAIKAHLGKPVPLAKSLRPLLPREVDAIIQKAVAKKPEDRIQTATEMAQALRLVAATLSPAQPVEAIIDLETPQTLLDQMATAGPISVPPPQPQIPSQTLSVEQPRAASQRHTIEQIPESEAPTQIIPAVSGKIIITSQTGSTITVHIDKPQLHIGRLRNNDVVLSAPDVSRQHARIEYSSHGWQIIDVGSAGGTRLAGKYLLPNQPRLWSANDHLKIGPYTLKWQKNEVPSEIIEPAASDWLVPNSDKHTPEEDGRENSQTIKPEQPVALGGTSQLEQVNLSGEFHLHLLHPEQVVTPGEMVEFEVLVRNEKPARHHLQLQVEGLSADWVTVIRDATTLESGQEDILTFFVHLPKRSDVTAGNHPYTLVVTSVQDASATAVANEALIVGGFSQFNIDAQPAHVSKQGIVQLSIQNEGNQDEAFAIVGEAPKGGIQFDGERGRLTVPVGQTKMWPIEIKASSRPFTGKNEQRPYTIRVGSKNGQEQTISGELEAPPRYPVWLLTVAAFLCTFTLFSLLLFIFYNLWGT